MTLELLHQDLSNHFYEYKGVTGGVFNRDKFILTSLVGMVGGIWQAYYMVMQNPSGAILGGAYSKLEALKSARENIAKFDDVGLRSHIEEGHKTQRERRETRKRLNEEYVATLSAATPEKPERPCAVYIIKVGDKYKIGKSLNPNGRIKNMQLPGKPETVRIFSVSRGARLELELHTRYAQKRGHGEWFSLSEADISDIDSYVEQWKQTEFA